MDCRVKPGNDRVITGNEKEPGNAAAGTGHACPPYAFLGKV
jgi:hypothetical protein